MPRQKQRGYPDRRGMGAQSDFIAEQFVPSKDYRTQQLAIARKLISSGIEADQVEKMFFIPYNLIADEKPNDL